MSFIPLNKLKKGDKAQIVQISEANLKSKSSLPEGELERRLLEMGFSEGSMITFLHEAPFGKDPIVVLLRTCHTIALRRQEASAILVQQLP